MRAREESQHGAGAEAVDGRRREKRRGIDWKRPHGRAENGYFMRSACMTEECGCLSGLLVICCPSARGRTKKHRQAGDKGLRAEDEQAMWALWL